MLLNSHPRARALTGTKSAFPNFQRESKTGCPADCLNGDPCCAESPVWGLIKQNMQDSCMELHSCASLCLSVFFSCCWLRWGGEACVIVTAIAVLTTVCVLLFLFSAFSQQKGPCLTYSTYHNPTGWTVPLRSITRGCRQLATNAVLAASPFHPPFHSHSHSSHPSHICLPPPLPGVS